MEVATTTLVKQFRTTKKSSCWHKQQKQQNFKKLRRFSHISFDITPQGSQPTPST
jgi:hypothetical protein